ncbi:hypothetical protein FKG96_06150 [Olivibacter sp. LS-1]|uniref:hypothetical protein n=1 Tax=Olivibacter sp. LS-1 TaxID=2592345 RepID=UPI0011EAEC94|nr:hypothetical protein [Olivibacter sp. LS-1]QEL00407.1 hypothetical protein FKG96_06150 [Olivibacter sp. LS-1]
MRITFLAASFLLLIPKLYAQTDIKSGGSYIWNITDEPKIFSGKLQLSFVSHNQGFPSYGTVLAGGGYYNTQDGGAFQLYIPYSSTYGGNAPRIRMGLYNNQGWSDWATFYTSTNANSATSDWKAKTLLVYDKIGIGTTSPQAALAVNGNILAKEIKVKADISVPDYVFEPDYKVLPLSDIEKFVKENKHLPEIPSAKDIEKDGLDLGAMNMALLKKVEELTLHLIELKKAYDDQQKQIEALQRK